MKRAILPVASMFAHLSPPGEAAAVAAVQTALAVLLAAGLRQFAVARGFKRAA